MEPGNVNGPAGIPGADLPGANAAGAEVQAEGSALDASRAQLRDLLIHKPLEESATPGEQFPRSKLMKAAFNPRYRSLWAAGGTAAMMVIGKRFPAIRVTALVNGYRMARQILAARKSP